MAHRALVPDSSYVAGERLVFAQWSVAVDAIEGSEAMAWVGLRGVANTL